MFGNLRGRTLKSRLAEAPLSLDEMRQSVVRSPTR
jgi:hypothetical protein